MPRHPPSPIRAAVLAAALPLRATVAGATEAEPIPAPAANPPARIERLEAIEEAELRRFDLYAGVGFVSQYVARGLVFLDEPSLQPWLELDVAILRDGAPAIGLRTLTVFAGSWTNVNLSGRDDGLARTGRAAFLDDWYEADVYAGVRMRVAGHVTTSLRYNFYTSPSGSFRDIHEIDWRVSLDDGPLWARLWPEAGVGLYPTLRIAKELSVEGGRENWYFSPSLTPTWRVSGLPFALTVEVPLVFGFGADGQYVGDFGIERHFGFFQTGLHLSATPELLPEGAGSLTITLGIDYVVLADEALGLDRQSNETIGRAGLSYAF